MKTYRRSGGLVVLAAATAAVLAALGGASSAHDAGWGKRSRRGSQTASSHLSRARSASTLANDNVTRLLSEWTTCERSNGDPGQAGPTVTHEVIHITPPTEAMPAGGLHGVAQLEYPSKACSQYLASAQRAVAGGQPVAGWGDHAKYVEYANCMRANGYPTFPYPSGRIEPDGNESTNFNGTGINPESPTLLSGNANRTCGKQIGAPAWWINDWGPPGSVEIARLPLPMAHPPFPAPGAEGGPAPNPGSGAAG